MISEKMYTHLDNHILIQKNPRKFGKVGTDRYLYRHITQKLSKIGKYPTILCNTKTYTIVWQSWIHVCLRIFLIADSFKKSVTLCVDKNLKQIYSKGKVITKDEFPKGFRFYHLIFVSCLFPLSLLLGKEKSGYQFRKKVRLNFLISSTWII